MPKVSLRYCICVEGASSTRFFVEGALLNSLIIDFRVFEEKKNNIVKIAWGKPPGLSSDLVIKLSQLACYFVNSSLRAGASIKQETKWQASMQKKLVDRQSESYICTCKNDFPGQYG